MIKANELRIGNKLSFYKPEQTEPKILTVTGIGEENGMYYVFSNDYSAINLDSGLIPIPITSELLIDCGFSLLRNSTFYEIVFNKKLIISIDIVDGEIYLDKKSPDSQLSIELFIKHLHQLQNLYFALTGEELTVNLHVATSN